MVRGPGWNPAAGSGVEAEEYRRFRRDGIAGYCRRDLEPGRLVELLLRPQLPYRVLKDSRSARILLGTAGGESGFFLKRYNYRGFRHAWLRSFRRPRAFRCLAAARKLAELGIPTPKVLAAATERRGGWLLFHQYLLTEALAETERFLPELLTDASDPEALVAEVLRFVARLHEAGIEHGDLSWRNLYRQEEDGAFGVIDLDGWRFHPRGVSAAVRCREVARVISSARRVLAAAGRPALDVDGAVSRAAAVYAAVSGVTLETAALRRRCARLLAHRGGVR